MSKTYEAYKLALQGWHAAIRESLMLRELVDRAEGRVTGAWSEVENLAGKLSINDRKQAMNDQYGPSSNALPSGDGSRETR